MKYALTGQQIEDEVRRAKRLVEEVERPSGIYGLAVQPDQDQDGNPMFLISISVDDEPNPTDKRLDELADYENRVTSKIWEGGFASWPLIQLVPNEANRANEP